MSNAQPTPGPWYYRPEEPSVEAEHRNNAGFFLTVADCGKSRTIENDEMQANARLIAAAPDLLNALQMFVAQYQGSGQDEREQRPEMQAARAALGKAKGLA